MTKRSIEDVRRDTDTLLQMERDWRDHLRKQDSGSYCESPSHEYNQAQMVLAAVYDARKALMKYGE